MQWARGHRSARILRRARAVPLVIAALTLAGFAVPSSASANSAPICRAADTRYVTLPDGSYRWELGDIYEELMFTCADPEKQPMTVQVTQAPQRGGASGNYDPRALPDAYLIYRGTAEGPDSARWSISDGVNVVDYAIRTTNVPAVNDPPVCEPNAVPTTTGVVTYFGRCDDDERAKQTLVLVRAPTKGTASLGGGSFASQFFTYKARTAGSDTFTAKSSDGTQESNALTFNITNPGTPAATQSPSIAGKRNVGTLRVSAKGRFTLKGQLIDCPGTGPNCAVAARVTTRRKQKRARSAAKRKTTTLARSSLPSRPAERAWSSFGSPVARAAPSRDGNG